MKLGVVTGQIVATRKDEYLTGTKLMITQPISAKEKAVGEELVAVDTVGAGVGETVLYVCGSVASRAMRNLEAPIDAAIAAIVDRIDSYGKK